MTRLEPVHPGEILKRDFMEPFALSSTALARALGVTPARINDIVRCRRGITAETALRLARYFNTGRPELDESSGSVRTHARGARRRGCLASHSSARSGVKPEDIASQGKPTRHGERPDRLHLPGSA